jgi:cold shock protein
MFDHYDLRKGAATLRSIYDPDAPDISDFEPATIKWIDLRKGYGFFAQPGRPDIFVHIEVLRRCGFEQISQGQRVLVRHCRTPQGRHALDIMPATR